MHRLGKRISGGRIWCGSNTISPALIYPQIGARGPIYLRLQLDVSMIDSESHMCARSQPTSTTAATCATCPFHLSFVPFSAETSGLGSYILSSRLVDSSSIDHLYSSLDTNPKCKTLTFPQALPGLVKLGGCPVELSPTSSISLSLLNAPALLDHLYSTTNTK